jgi:glycosyltransferase involved in cell wall biosynthesis
LKIAIFQPSIPVYREHFFDVLAGKLELQVFASCVPNDKILDATSKNMGWLTHLPAIHTIKNIFHWQSGVVAIGLTKFDVVVIDGDVRYLSNIVLLLKARLCGVPVVWWGHYRSSTSKNWRVLLRLFLLRLSNAVLFYTDNEVALFKKKFPKSVIRVGALNNGLDNSKIISNREKYVSQFRKNEILFIGRLTKKAEIDVLVRAVAQIRDVDIKVHIIGDGPLLKTLKQLSRELNIQSTFHWHGIVVNESSISTIANRCKLFVYPGAVGLSVIHAMNYGLPIITHGDELAHMPEYYATKKKKVGMCFERSSVKSLASVISLMLTSRELDDYSSAAISITSNSFNSRDMSRRFMTLLEEVAGNGT